MSMITETIDRNEDELYEGLEQLVSLIKNSGLTNKEVRRYNKILKNLTKQIWSKFDLYHKRHKRIAKNKEYVTVPMDKKFFDGFLKALKAPQETIDGVYETTDRQIKTLTQAFEGVREGEKTLEEINSYFKSNNIKPMKVVSDVINSMALETTLHHMNDEVELEPVEDSNKIKVLHKMGNATRGIGRDIIQGTARATQERSK